MSTMRAIDHFRSDAAQRLIMESRRVAAFLDRRMNVVLAGWVLVTLALAGLKLTLLIAAHPKLAHAHLLASLVGFYLLVAMAPVLGFIVVDTIFPKGRQAAQPTFRLCRVGRWVNVPAADARQKENFGMSGLLVSLVAGLCVSIALRMAEYFLSMPAVPDTAPAWAVAMFRIMTFDLIYFSFLYSICIAMALRAVPLFPRMLCYTWLCDLLMQIAIARFTVGVGGLPDEVSSALQPYLLVNIKKILISVVIWFPYLVVSRRINLTFRQRMKPSKA
jgi:hypothetical protein